MNNVLAGLRVVEGSAFVAAPSGGMTLAQLGADVIRFDPIGGGIDHRRWPTSADGTSLYWAGLNKGKRSIQVDLRSPAGRELLTELICAPGENSGIFLTNFPAVGWMSYETLSAARRDLVMLSITGNHDGSSAVDYTVNCAMGYPEATGPEDAVGPINHVLPAWDLICGQTAALGLLGAERHRRVTGTGQHVTLALSDVALAAVAALGHVAEAQLLGRSRPRLGNDLYGALGRDFETSDGRRVIAVAISAKQWSALCEATAMTDEMSSLATDTGLDLAADEGARFEVRDRIFPLIERWCAARPYAEVAATFDRLGVCWGPYQSFGELVQNDTRCSTSNPMFQEIEQPGLGRYLTPGSPLRFGGLESDEVAPAPTLGQHTEQVLAEVLGLNSAETGRLRRDGVVA
jgi:2-methylfumaryl-CoA isomerase